MFFFFQKVRNMAEIKKYGYGCTPSKILKPKWDRIEEDVIGIEAEFDNIKYDPCEGCYNECNYCEEDTDVHYNDEIIDKINYLIENNFIINPDNEKYAKEYGNIVIERDSSVDLELIFQADKRRNIMRNLSKLSKELEPLSQNSTGTSFHIHRNKNWILKEYETSFHRIQDTTEFLLPILYLISGRTPSSYESWCHSIFRDFNNNIPETLWEIGKRIDNIDEYLYYRKDKYLACNIKHNESLEFRIFSNYHNLNYEISKLFIDSTNLIMEISQYMNEKSFCNEYETLIDWLQEWKNGNRRRRKLLNKYNFDNLLINKRDCMIKDLNKRYDDIYKRILYYSNHKALKNYHMSMLFDDIKDINNDLEFDIDIICNKTTGNYFNINFNDVFEYLNASYYEELNNL